MKCKSCQQKALKCEECGKPIPWGPDQPLKDLTDLKHLKDQIEDSGCMHKNCPGCKAGTCSGIHMISCPCKDCSPTC